jgi:hypothetical protein
LVNFAGFSGILKFFDVFENSLEPSFKKLTSTTTVLICFDIEKPESKRKNSSSPIYFWLGPKNVDPFYFHIGPPLWSIRISCSLESHTPKIHRKNLNLQGKFENPRGTSSEYISTPRDNISHPVIFRSEKIVPSKCEANRCRK